MGDGGTFGLRAGAGEDRAAEKDARQTVVFCRGEGVEFMVVAPCTGHGYAEQGAGDDVHLVVDNVADHFLLVGIALGPVSDGEHAGGDEAVAVKGAFLGGEEVPGDLVADEFIVGHVFIDGVDDPVAVAPDFDGVGLVGAPGVERVGIADHVEPVPCPTFAIARRSEEALDQIGVGVGCFVREKGVYRFGGGRQPGEIIGDAPNEGALVGRG